MQRSFTLIAIYFIAAPLCSWLTTANAGTFKGAWFEIWIPDDFQATPSLRSATAQGGFDSAFFQSPDRHVEFYVYSPQWNGEPTDIVLDPSKESVSATETKTAPGKIVTWYTIDARDGSYTRSYQDTRSTDASTRAVVGVKYDSKAAYDRFKDSYLKFKNSLRQFAD